MLSEHDKTEKTLCFPFGTFLIISICEPFLFIIIPHKFIITIFPICIPSIVPVALSATRDKDNVLILKLLIMFCYPKNLNNKFFFSENSIRKRTAI